MRKTEITISIPAYNDKHSLTALLNEIKILNLSEKFKASILIIDDGSTDGTFERLQNYVIKDIPIQFVRNQQNKGFGDSFKKAFTLPTSEWVFFISGDHQFPANNLFAMASLMDDYDLIIGKRNKRSDNLYRRLNSKIYNAVISILAHKKITDVNSIVLFKSEILKNLNLKSTSAFINAEFILKALEKNYKFIEVPIIHQSRKHGRGSGGKWSVIKKVIKDVIKYMFS